MTVSVESHFVRVAPPEVKSSLVLPLDRPLSNQPSSSLLFRE